MSINWASRQANIEAPTAIPVNPKTFENVLSLTGDHSVAVVALAIITIASINTLANSPDSTTELAFFLPYISEMISVTKKVMGQGIIPADISKV